jgi:protein SCO1/2
LLLLLLVAAGPFDPFGAAGIDARIGAAVPMQAPLVDQDGRAVTLAGIAGGRPLLLVPVLHQCPNLCGVTLAGLVGAVRGQSRVAGRDFVVVAFGIDPHEGPDTARADLTRLAAAEAGRPNVPVVAVTGSPDAIAAVTQAIGYRYAWDPRIGQYAHAAATALVTPDGHLSSWLYGVQPAPADLARGLDLAARDGSGSLVEQLILLCYHFDPATGTWSLLIGRVVRAAGLVTVLALALLLVRLSRRRAAA